MTPTAEGTPSLSRGKRIAFVGGTLVALVALVAVLAEVVYRMVAPPAQVFDLSGLHEFRPEKGWLYRGRPGAAGEVLGMRYEINADGFRGPVHTREADPARPRIVLMGDSIAFGYGVRVAQTFPRVLEDELAERAPDLNAEVVNLGVGGYNAWNEARLLEDVGVTYEPDIVLVQFAINDLNDPTVHITTQTRLAIGVIPEEAYPDPARARGGSPLRRLAARACNPSRLCQALRLRAAEGFRPLRQGGEPVVRAFREPIERTDRVEWQWLEARYLEMAEAAESVGARFGVIAFPYEKQLPRAGEHPVSRHLRELCERHGWLFVDPLPTYQTADKKGTNLFIDLWHPTVAGHVIAARVTAQSLIDQGAFATD